MLETAADNSSAAAFSLIANARDFGRTPTVSELSIEGKEVVFTQSDRVCRSCSIPRCYLPFLAIAIVAEGPYQAFGCPRRLFATVLDAC